jgi:hypothetical protein
MNSNTAWQAWARRRSSPAQPAHGLADAGGRQLRDHARAFGRRQARAVRQDPGVGHEQFLPGSRFTPEHDPAESHLGIHGQDHLGQLHLADALIEPSPQLDDFGVLLIGGQRRQVQLVVNAQCAGTGGRRDGVDAGAHALQQRRKELARPGRQLQPSVVTPRFGLPAPVRDEQPISAAKAQRMFEPDRAVAQCAAQRE